MTEGVCHPVGKTGAHRDSCCVKRSQGTWKEVREKARRGVNVHNLKYRFQLAKDRGLLARPSDDNL